MTGKVKTVAVLSICTALLTALESVAGFAAHADNPGAAMSSGIGQLRPACGTIRDDPRLTAAAQRHANDMLTHSVDGHIGSDGSLPQGRIKDAGYRARRTGEIVFWGPGSATPSDALDMWMHSPAHRAIILNCAYTAVGFATASDGNRMTAVGDFAG